MPNQTAEEGSKTYVTAVTAKEIPKSLRPRRRLLRVRMLGDRPGDRAEIGREAQELPDSRELPEVEQEMVADDEEDGQAAQEIDLPNAGRGRLFIHGVRIVQAGGRRQGAEKLTQ
jgi:hypothetical protein